MNYHCFLHPGCNISDFKIGSEVSPYKYGMNDLKLIVVDICYTTNLIFTDDLSCWGPNELWPAYYGHPDNGSVYVDFDNTLAHYNGLTAEPGDPRPYMLSYIRYLLSHGYRVKIFTARVDWEEYDSSPIRKWCIEHVGEDLEITNIKERDCIMIVDDRAYNTNHIESVIMDLIL